MRARMKDVNEITICKDQYEDQYDFEEAIKSAVMLLLNNDYIMNVRYDDKNLGIVVIEYNPADSSWGNHYPYWLLPEEIEQVDANVEGE